MTLVELMVSIGVGALVAIVMLALSLYAGRSLAGISNYLDLEAQSRNTLDQLSRDARSAAVITAITSDRLSLRTAANSSLTYEYFPSTRTVERLSDGVWKKVLTECDQLQFVLYRAPTNGSAYYAFTGASGTNGQVLGVTWTCARGLPVSKLTTESSQSARIVIRNAP